MRQEDIPHVNSINLTPADQDELDWTSMIMHLINQSEDGSILAPMMQYSELQQRLLYIVPSFVHEN